VHTITHDNFALYDQELQEQDYLMTNKADTAIFLNKSKNESKKIKMFNNREFGAINKKPYFYSLSCAII